MQMYRVVPQTKKGDLFSHDLLKNLLYVDINQTMFKR